MEIVVRCAMTSRDAQEIADKLRDIERNGRVGQSNVAKDWIVDSPEGMQVTVRIYLDQTRATNQGLMR